MVKPANASPSDMNASTDQRHMFILKMGRDYAPPARASAIASEPDVPPDMVDEPEDADLGSVVLAAPHDDDGPVRLVGRSRVQNLAIRQNLDFLEGPPPHLPGEPRLLDSDDHA